MHQPYFRSNRNTWYVHHNGRQVSLGKNREIAFRKWHELKAELGAAQAIDKRLCDVLVLFLDWCRRKRTPRTLEWYERHFGGFIKHRNNGQLRISALKPHHVECWVDDCFDGLADTTKRGGISAVVGVLNRLKKLGYIDDNPLWAMDRPQVESGGRYITPEEWKLIEADLRERNEYIQDAVLFLWHTGCRPQELRGAQCEYFNAGLRSIVFPKKLSKGKRHQRVIPLNDVAFSIVQRLVLKNSDGPIFRSSLGNGWSASGLRGIFRRYEKRFGIVACPYDVRHTFATNAIQRGIDLITLSEIMGHRDLRMLNCTF